MYVSVYLTNGVGLCVSHAVMYQSCKSLKETMSEVYEPEWAGYDSYKDVMEVRSLCPL